MNIFLFGAQGSGKSTIGTYLGKKLGIPFIATGDIFRKLRQENTELGKKVREIIDAGKLVPDDITMEIVNKRINEEDTKGGFILDGAPRSLEQEKALSRNPDLIIMVTLDEKEAWKRMVQRGRVDDTEESIKKRLSWYREKVEPVVEHYRKLGVKFVEVDNTPAESLVQKKLDGLFEN